MLPDDEIERIWSKQYFLPAAQLINICAHLTPDAQLINVRRHDREDLEYLRNLVDLHGAQANLANVRIFYGMDDYITTFLQCGSCTRRIIAINERDVQVCDECKEPIHELCLAEDEPEGNETCKRCRYHFFHTFGASF
jgi:hypothetical protein